jgi:hypothetical protein
MRKHTVIVIIAVAIALALFERGQLNDWLIELRKPAVPREQPRPTGELTPTPTPRPVPPGATDTPTPSRTPSPTFVPVTGAINLAVPFSSQAPRGDWSLPWQEACEEASSILVDLYWRGLETSVEQMERDIYAAIDWETRTLGYYEHTTAAETARMLREHFGYRRVDVIGDATIADIVREVRAGRPVIVPLAGRLLGNPYYTQPGPIYHMLVVKGVTESGDLITNDVGTRHGKNLTYTPDVFYNAMHDVPEGGSTWPPGVDPAEYILTGAKRIIVVYPN